MAIVGCGCQGSSSTLTSCCTGGTGGFRKLPGLCATNTAPQRGGKERMTFLLLALTTAVPHSTPHIRDSGTYRDSDSTRARMFL